MILIDNFLSEDKFSWCKDNQDEIFDHTNLGTRFWSGWWSKPPSNMCEELIHIIFNSQHLISYLGSGGIEKFSGFEYWTNILTAQLGWHIDNDEISYASGNAITSPPISCVFYFSEPIAGGFLEISSTTYDRSYKTINTLSVERIKPIENRLVVFNPKYWHRVCDIEGERCAITINVWDQLISKNLE